VGDGGALARILGAAWAGLAEALYPRLCWLCGARAQDGYGCERHALERARFAADEPRCEGCLERLPAGLLRGPCAHCRRTPRGYRRLVALGEYAPDSPLRDWILALKHGGRAELAGPLAAALVQAWRASGTLSRGARLVPVPLHPWRALERGHDQARALARALAFQAEVELVPALRRARWTAPQGSPGARSREANVAGAFRLRAAAAARLVDQGVWLVDDVVTSGATVRACATLLRAAGAREVSVLALARVPRAAEADEGSATLPGP